jgi:hypothetical protein
MNFFTIDVQITSNFYTKKKKKKKLLETPSPSIINVQHIKYLIKFKGKLQQNLIVCPSLVISKN